MTIFKVTGLWLNEMKDKDEKYMSGNIGGMRIVILKNTFKEEGSNEPDYNLYFAENKKREVPKVEDNDVPF